ncbi:uncharacterized protein LOC109803886 [Cajanus cajan]|uniref:PB1 domain-containing protein n=1 Tax=Cajanus cajan TaxID=3821 RepID=A0A151T851_CAJCA|nr:uncharacterized protein LOC109803886 [Cajanus cajan]KYP63217.1 hypothetical protein KK1_017784 [Cajanus cajan]
MGEESPKNKVKFLCSYGGKVLPRPSDGLLRYVGGETRVVSVPRQVTLKDLMNKVNNMVEADMVLKYQLMPEDLDALVSVRTEEDVKHMIEEHDRHHTGNGLLRAFLFPPSKPTLLPTEPYPLEQRYIDAINGITRTSPKAPRGSTCSSPKSSSPEYSPRYANANVNALAHATAHVMQKVRSSPSLTNMDHQHHHPYTSRPPHDPQMGMGMGMGRLGGRAPAFNYYYSNTNTNTNTNTRQTHNHRGYAFQDDSASYTIERLQTVPRSPIRKSIWE